MKLTKGAIQAIAREIIRKARTQQDNVIEGLKTNEVILSLVDSDLKLFAKMSAGGKKYFGRNNSTEKFARSLSIEWQVVSHYQELKIINKSRTKYCCN